MKRELEGGERLEHKHGHGHGRDRGTAAVGEGVAATAGVVGATSSKPSSLALLMDTVFSPYTFVEAIDTLVSDHSVGSGGEFNA